MWTRARSSRSRSASRDSSSAAGSSCSRGEDLEPLRCLHATESAVSFLVIDPRLVLPGYRCQLSQTDLVRLGADEHTALLWLAVVTVDEAGLAFANLRAPIVVNPERMLGYQVMPHNSLYPLRHPLASD